MQTVHFLGHVLPPQPETTVRLVPSIAIHEELPDLNATFTTRITNSKIDIECTQVVFSEDNYFVLYIRAYEMVRSLVDLITFASGIRRTVHLDTL